MERHVAGSLSGLADPSVAVIQTSTRYVILHNKVQTIPRPTTQTTNAYDCINTLVLTKCPVLERRTLNTSTFARTSPTPHILLFVTDWVTGARFKVDTEVAVSVIPQPPPPSADQAHGHLSCDLLADTGNSIAVYCNKNFHLDFGQKESIHFPSRLPVEPLAPWSLPELLQPSFQIVCHAVNFASSSVPDLLNQARPRSLPVTTTLSRLLISLRLI
ncbi:hypothetical protein Pmani_036229 [Petrolisthes manimaculis]|uniref:Uncharacterized protein n=1 Tax=Petrolisthes manimaculis TaxID=1843537 RepID=A0AAE1NK53_9EUCA|nr:hypothetical protein Pmani_036229 [Petrolisthes manimaculis]